MGRANPHKDDFDHATSNLLLFKMLGLYQLDITSAVIDIVNIVQCKHFAPLALVKRIKRNTNRYRPIPATAFQGRGSDGGVIEPFLESVGQGSDLVREEVSQPFQDKEVVLRFSIGRLQQFAQKNL